MQPLKILLRDTRVRVATQCPTSSVRIAWLLAWLEVPQKYMIRAESGDSARPEGQPGSPRGPPELRAEVRAKQGPRELARTILRKMFRMHVVLFS